MRQIPVVVVHHLLQWLLFLPEAKRKLGMSGAILSHLESLEADRYQELPGGVFRKGIARGYLSALGLEEGPWIERFEASLRNSGESTEAEGDWSQFATNVKRSRGSVERNMGMRWVGVLVLLGLLVALGFLAWKYVLAGRVKF